MAVKNNNNNTNNNNAAKAVLLFTFLLGTSHAAASSSSSSEYARYQSCRRTCQDYFDTKVHREVCRPALNLLPRPGVYHACLNGIKYGFKASCVPACLHDDNDNDHDDQDQEHRLVADSFTACQRESGRASPNHEFDWCRRGFDATFEEMTAWVSSSSSSSLTSETGGVETVPGETRRELKIVEDEEEEEVLPDGIDSDEEEDFGTDGSSSYDGAQSSGDMSDSEDESMSGEDEELEIFEHEIYSDEDEEY